MPDEERFQSASEADLLMMSLLGRVLGEETGDPEELRPLRAVIRELVGGDEVCLRCKGATIDIDVDVDVEAGEAEIDMEVVEVEEWKDELPPPESSSGGGG